MHMKNHILAALEEELVLWEQLLAGLDEGLITAPQEPSELSLKDVVVHLWAWQQRSIARVEAALRDREPEFPEWLPGVDPEDFANTDRVNAWIYAAYRTLPWIIVHQNWRAGFQRFLEAAQGITERDLLDSSRYPWLNGCSLADILLGAYDHHQEHLDTTVAGGIRRRLNPPHIGK